MSTEAAVGATTLTVSNNWLDTKAYSFTGIGNEATVGYYVGSAWYPYLQPYTFSTYWPPKLKLKLSEVEHLRKLAAKDKALRATLQKFTPYIEIEVDF